MGVDVGDGWDVLAAAGCGGALWSRLVVAGAARAVGLRDRDHHLLETGQLVRRRCLQLPLSRMEDDDDDDADADDADDGDDADDDAQPRPAAPQGNPQLAAAAPQPGVGPKAQTSSGPNNYFGGSSASPPRKSCAHTV